MNMLNIRNLVFNIIEKVINQNLYDCVPEFIEILNKHKVSFINLLQNDPLNATDRNMVVNSFKEPISIPDLPQKVTLTQDIIQETIIISDLFKLNEMTSVELLLSGEAESTSNPDMTRGLIAVLSYYNSQKLLVDSLKYLLQTKFIVINDDPRALELINFTESYCDSLFSAGLFPKLLDLLNVLNLENEIDLLESQRALGNAKHRRQFVLIFNSIRETLCECIMLRSYKTPFNTKETQLFIEFMRNYYREPNREIKSDENALVRLRPKNIDKCFAFLLVSLMNSMNPIMDGNSVTNCSKNCFNHPFFTHDDYFKTINEVMRSNIDEIANCEQKDPDVTKTFVQNFDQILYLTWIISTHKMSHMKQEKLINSPYEVTSNFGDYDDFLECDSFNLDSKNLYECFSFLADIVNLHSFHAENIWIKCFHDFVTDFIIYLPKMLKDLKTESLRSKSGVIYFSSLLTLIGSLYEQPYLSKDLSNVLKNEFLELLTLEFWSPQEIMSGSDMPALLVFDNGNKNWSAKSNDSYRQATLFKFIRDCADLFDHPQLFIDYIFMLKGLCTGERVALYIYSMLNSNQIGHHNSKLTWEWFSSSIYQHANFLISTTYKMQLMDPMELRGLLIVLKLIKRVSKMSPKVCESITRNESMMLVQNLALLLSCPVPELLKAELLNCLSVFCQNALVAKYIWQLLESNKIISSSPESSGCSIQTELNETEPKSEEFHTTRAFLNFLLAVTPHIVVDIALLDQSMMTYDRMNSSIVSAATHYTMVGNFTYVVQTVMESVFLMHTMRTYRNIEDKFAICESFLKLSYKCVDLFISQIGNTKGTKNKLTWCQYDPGFFIVNQLLTESQFFKIVISIIDNGFSQITDSLNNVSFGPKTFSNEAVELLGNSVYLAMDLLSIVLRNESLLLELNSRINSQFKNESYRSGLRLTRQRNAIPQELSRLLMTTSCAQMFLPNLIKYISIVDENEKIAKKALSIFNNCIKLIQPHSNLMLMLTNRNVIDTDILPLMVNCIDKYGDIDVSMAEFIETEGISNIFFNDRAPDSPRTLALKVLINCLQQSTPNLGQYLMGFSCDSVFAVKRTSLQEAGVGDFPKTCLHSLLNLITRLVSEMVSNPIFKETEIPTDYLAILTANMMDLSLAYRILYLLASNTHTSKAVLRFIRSNYQFIFNQIDLLAFNTSKLASIPELRALIWNQKSWLMKIIAIEVRLCTANQQRSYIAKLLKLLFGEDLYSSNNNDFVTWMSDENTSYQGLLYQLLEDFDVTEPEELNDFSICQRLKPEILKEYLNDSLEETFMGIQMMNATKLKQMIFADINMTVDEEQLRVVHHEIDDICRFIGKYNTNMIWLQFGKSSAVDAWHQVVEVVMLSDCSGEDYIDMEIKRKKLYEVLHLVNEKILVSSTPSCLVTSFSRVCLILSAVLAEMFVCDKNKTCLASQVMPSDEVENAEEKRLESIDLGSLYSQLRVLIKQTTRCIMEINYKYQNTRIKFYGVLTYLLEIVLKISSLKSDFSNLLNECYLAINNHSLLLETISERSLYSTVCCDCVSGNIHLALSSLTLLDSIASVDKGSGGLTSYLMSHGYLNHLIDSLVRDCGNIFLNMKHIHDTNYMRESGNPNDSYPHFLYLSRMSLLCKLATQPASARALVQVGALSSLSNCELFKTRPSIRDSNIEIMLTNDDDMEDVHVQYRNIISYAVQFANNILSTLGNDKTDAVREVLVFIGESIDCLCDPFQSSANLCNTASLKEMIQISNLFVLLVPGILNTKSLVEVEFKYRALEKIKISAAHGMTYLLGLLNKSIHTEHDMMQHLLQIQLMGNFLSIASGIVAPSSSESRRMFFSSNVDDAIGYKNNWNSVMRKISQSVMSGNKPPMSLIVIVLCKMQECYEDIHKKVLQFASSDYEVSGQSHNSKKGLSTREIEDNLSRMSADQLKLLWNSVFDNVSNQLNGDYLSNGHMIQSIEDNSTRNPIKADLVKDLILVYKRINNVLSSLVCSLENCCFLLWNHVLAYKSTCSNDSLANDVNLHPIQRLHKMQQIKRELDQTRNNVTNEDIVFILSKCIDDDLLYKIGSALEMNDDGSSFSQILIHRLTRMLKLS